MAIRLDRDYTPNFDKLEDVIQINPHTNKIEKLKVDKNGYTEIPKQYFRQYAYLTNNCKKNTFQINMLTEEEKKSFQERKLNFAIKKYNKLFNKNLDKKTFSNYHKMQLCEKDLTCFSIFCLNRVPRPHQMFVYELYDHPCFNKRLLLLESRRFGKTITIITIQMRSMRFNKIPYNDINGDSWLTLCGRKEDVELIYFAELYALIEVGDRTVAYEFEHEFGSDFFTRVFPKRTAKSQKVTKNILSFDVDDPLGTNTNKASRCSLRGSAITNKLRGTGNNIVLDEMSVADTGDKPAVKDALEFYENVLEPMVSDNDDLVAIVSGTPEGFTNGFAKLANPEEEYPLNGFLRVWFPYYYSHSQDYINRLYNKEIEAFKRGKESYNRFCQEYLAQFNESSDQYFSEIQHIKVFFKHHIEFLGSSKKPCVAALDWGQKKSKSALVIIEETDDEQNTVIYRQTFEGYETDKLMKEIIRIQEYYNLHTFVYDSRGGGELAKLKIKEIVSCTIEEYTFSGGNNVKKINDYETLRRCMEKKPVKKKIRCPPDMEIMMELRNFTKDLKPKLKTQTDDLLDSIMMANSYICEPNNFIGVSIEETEEDDFSVPENELNALMGDSFF